MHFWDSCKANFFDLSRDPKSLVTFLVGPDPAPVEFLVHKEVVCHHSRVLAAAFNGNFTEGQTQTYRLQDTTERAFRLLVQWIYSQKLNLLQTSLERVASLVGDRTAKADDDCSLVELWELADKFEMPLLQNHVIDSMDRIHRATKAIPSKTFNYTCEIFNADCPLRRYQVALCVNEIDKDFITKCPEDFPHKMLIEMCRLFISTRARKIQGRLLMSDYYVKVGDN